MNTDAKYPSAALDRINFRLPDGLRDRIKDAAKINNRSMNSELIARLEASFDAGVQIAPAFATLLESHIQQEVAARLKAIAASIGETR